MEPLSLFTIKSKEEFIEKYSTLDKLEKDWLPLLIQTFGYNYATTLCELLGNEVKEIYVHQLSSMQVLQNICFECLLKREPVTQQIIEEYQIFDHLNVHTADKFNELMDQETKNYLCASHFPQQTAKLLGLYNTPWIRELVDGIQERLLKAINKLSANIFLPDDNDEALLYRHAALIWFGKSISYAEMNIAMICDNKEVYIKTSSIYYKLFIEGRKLIPLVPAEGSLSSHRFKATLYTFFDYEETCLPEGKFMNELHFCASEQDRQDAFCMINKLHQLYNKKTKNFDFDQALQALKWLELDETKEVYHFLHTLVHYFRLLSFHSDDKALRPFLFGALYEYPNLQDWDFSTPEDIPKQPFEMDRATCKFLKKHFDQPFLWVPIFYNLSEKEVNLSDHIELARIMEVYILKKPLPQDLLYPFLQHRPAKKTLASVLDALSDLKIDGEEFRTAFLNSLNCFEDNLLKKMELLSDTLYYGMHPVVITSFTHETIVQYDRNGTINFEKSLFLLDALNVDQNTYDTFHAHIHSMKALEYIYTQSELEKEMLMQDIRTLPLERRKAFDQRIIEKQALRVKPKFAQLKLLFDKHRGISSEERAETYLQIAHTQSKGITAATGRSYLSLPQLDQFFDLMTEILGISPPSECVAVMIILRLVKDNYGKIFGNLKNWMEVQNRAKIDNLASFDQIERLKKDFLGEIEEPANVFEVSNPRHDRFMKNAAALAEFLEIACCPSSVLSTFKIGTNDTFFQPLHPKLPLGYLKMNFWLHEGKQSNFIVILKKGSISRFFLQPYQLPANDKDRASNFKFIEETIAEIKRGENDDTIAHTFANALMNNFTKTYYDVHPFTTLLETEKGIEVNSKYLRGLAEGKKSYHSDHYLFTFHPENGNTITQNMKIVREMGPVKFTLSIGSTPLTMEYPSDEVSDSAFLYQAALLFLINRELKPAKVIQEIEEILMMQLPDSIRNEILASHSEKNLTLFNEYKEIQSAVKTHVFSTLDINALLKELLKLKKKLLLEFDIPSKQALAELLELSCCPPSSLASICNTQDIFTPLHHKLPSGPIILVQPDFLTLKKERISCLFPINSKDHFSEGYYYLFNQGKNVSCTTISQTIWGFSCRYKGIEYKVKKQEYIKLMVLKNSPKGQFEFKLWKQGELGETQFTQTFYIDWNENSNQIILQTEENSLTLLHPPFKNNEEWIDAVSYQAALLYFQCKELKTFG